MAMKFRDLWPSWKDFACDVIGAICLFGSIYTLWLLAYAVFG